MSYIFNKEAAKYLQQHGVSEKQYTIWAWLRFRNQAFWSGIVIGLIFTTPILWGAYIAYQEGDTKGLWGMIAGAILVGSIFLFGAFWTKSGGPTYIAKPGYTPRGFEAIDLARRSSLKYVGKLKDQHWRAIQKIDVQVFEAKEETKNPGMHLEAEGDEVERLVALKSKMKNTGLIGAGYFVVTLVVFPLYLLPLVGDSVWRFVLMAILGAIFLVTTIGLHMWLFLYGYVGYLKREICLFGEFSWDTAIHHGKWATVFGVIAMCVAGLSFAFFILVPIGLLMGWK